MEVIGHPLNCQEQRALSAELLTPQDVAGERIIAPELQAYPDASGASVSVLSEAQAQNLFDHFKKLSHIPSRYLEDGCYARSQELTLIAAQMGVEMGKIFATPQSSLLYPRNIGAERFDRNFQGWKYHTSPYVLVRNASGELRPLIFDIGVGPEVYELTDWKKNLSRDDVTLSFRSRKTIYPSSENESEESLLGCLRDNEELIKKNGLERVRLLSQSEKMALNR